MIEKLKELGLSHYESKALEILLKEELIAKELSKKAGIPLGKVYSIISSLEKKNLIKQTETRPKKIYVENASEVIDCLIQKKIKKHEETLQEIREFAIQADLTRGEKPRFLDIGTTSEDNRRIQLRTFTEAQKEVCQILNLHHKPHSNRISKMIWEKEIVNATKRGVVFRSIYPVNCKLPKILAELNQNNPDKFQIKKLDLDFIRCDIIDKRKLLLKVVHKDATNFGMVMLLENEKAAKNMQTVFEQFWEEAQ